MDGDGLSSLGEKGKVRTFVVVKFFYIFDQLLMRSLRLEKLSINNFAINSDFHIFLLLKDQTNHYHDKWFILTILVTYSIASLFVCKQIDLHCALSTSSKGLAAHKS